MMTRRGLLARTIRFLLAGGLLAGALLMALSSVAVSAPGATINVTTTADEYGTGSGCSLREALEAINTGASFGGCDNDGTADTIQLQATTYTLTILAAGDYYTHSKGSLDIYNKSVTIQGAGALQTVISGAPSFDDRVFRINYDTMSPAGAVRIEGLTIQGGNASGGGGGIYAYMPGGNGNSTLTLVDVILRDNQATGNGGGLWADNGPIITLRDVAVTGNSANFGGGIHYATRYAASPEKLQMTNVTISDNQAQNSGGGLYANYGYEGAPVIEATNVTFANNRAPGGSGGNIYNKQSTISLRSTILTGGTDEGGANNCAGDPSANITSLGYNVDSGTTCGLTGTGDLQNQNPMLGPLADNGGGTLTHALQAASPALDRISLGTNGCGTTITTDQRGISRPQPAGGACDMGAFELKQAAPVPFVPEASTMVLLGSGLAGLAGYASLRLRGWRRRE